MDASSYSEQPLARSCAPSSSKRSSSASVAVRRRRLLASEHRNSCRGLARILRSRGLPPRIQPSVMVRELPSSRSMRFVVLCLVAACHTGANTDTCHAASDCGFDGCCVGPEDPPPLCGDGAEHCGSDQDCPSGERCHSILDDCRFTSMCGAPCPATSCGSNFVCNADQACQPIPCDQGSICPSYQHCDPGATIASGPIPMESDGCIDVICTSDGDCASSETCVNGYCQTSIGACTSACGGA
jgi:hypothetical protein